MSSVSSSRPRVLSKHLEVCISGIGHLTEPHTLLAYFEQFGDINHYNFTAPNGGGIVFITYEHIESVDRCMTHRPHRLDGRHLYVKRAVPFDAEHPREHIDSTRDLMIVMDSLHTDEEFLHNLREYFSYYGTLYACKYCHEENFDYILVEFADFDQVDRILLDKPHYFNNEQLHVMKCIQTNKLLLNIKYSSKETSLTIKDAIDVDDDQQFLKYELNYKSNLSEKKFSKDNQISEIDLENEVHRLQNVLKKMTEEFSHKRKQLEEECCEQLRKLNENAGQTHRLQQDLEQEYDKLLVEYQELKRENELLNEQYITVELENFEITSYYEQILAEEKAKTSQYEREYTEKLQQLCTNDSSLPSSPRLKSISRTSTSSSSPPPPPAIPNDEDDD